MIDSRRYPKSRMSVLTITVAGAFLDEPPPLDVLIETFTAAIRTFPGFAPGYPPLSVSVISLPDLEGEPSNA